MNRGWREAIFRNAGLKFVSLMLAFLLWTAVASSPQAEIGFSTPIEFHHVPPDMEIVTDFVPQAQVRVRGSDRVVRLLSNQDIHVILDLAKIKDQRGEMTFPLTAENVRVPANIDIVQIVPAQVRLSYDRRVRREVEVRPRVLGTMAPGHRITKVTIDPERVAIIGPEQRVNAVDSAVTDSIDVSGLMGTQSYFATPQVPVDMVRLERPQRVRVTVTTSNQK